MWKFEKRPKPEWKTFIMRNPFGRIKGSKNNTEKKINAMPYTREEISRKESSISTHAGKVLK